MQIQIEDDHFHDHCAVCGVYGHPEAAKLAYLCLYALQHRGQESAGIVSSDGQQLYTHKDMGLVQDIFQPQVLAKLPGMMAVGHTRYSTAGDKTLTNAQPIVIDCNRGTLALGHNGNLTNALDCRKTARTPRLDFSNFERHRSDRASAGAQHGARTLAGALADALGQVEGAYSLVMLTREELWAIRDPRGFRPLSLGRLGDAWLDRFGDDGLRFGGRDLRAGDRAGRNAAHLARGRGIAALRAREAASVLHFRARLFFAAGQRRLRTVRESRAAKSWDDCLRAEHPADADIVVPVPDSGVPAAIGYSD